MPNIKLISIGLIVLFWLAFARTPVVLVTALTSTLSPALVNAQESQDEVKTTKISCRAPVHQTGQTKCYRYNENKEKDEEVSCENIDKSQDGKQKKGAKWDPQSRFTDNQDGTVTDNLTGLIWLQNANCFDSLAWDDALLKANELADHDNNDCGLSDGSQAGDWRLPNIKELQSLISYGKRVNGEGGQVALPEGHPFTGVQPYYYWSSSTGSGVPGKAWGVYLGNGSVSRVR